MNTRAPTPSAGNIFQYLGHQDVRGLVLGVHGSLVTRLTRLGLDPDDVLQEVHVGLMTRTYNPSKKTPAAFVVLASRGVLQTLLTQATKPARARMESLGVTTLVDGNLTDIDASLDPRLSGPATTQDEFIQAIDSLAAHFPDDARLQAVVRLLALGHTPDEIQARLDVGSTRVGQIIKEARSHLKEVA